MVDSDSHQFFGSMHLHRAKQVQTQTLREGNHFLTWTIMPRSHIHDPPRRFYYELNLTDDPRNANFRSLIRMHYIRMINYNYV